MTAVVAPAPAALEGNVDVGPILTLTAHAATLASARIMNLKAVGIKLVIDVTAITGTSPTLTVALRGYDNASGKSFTVLASAAITTVSTVVLTVYPGVTAVANVAANDHLPTQWDVNAVIGGTSPAVTATIGAHLLF
jgi:hypothetical protein